MQIGNLGSSFFILFNKRFAAFVSQSCLFRPYYVKTFFLENQGFFSVSSINISEEGAIEMDISLYLVRK